MNTCVHTSSIPLWSKMRWISAGWSVPNLYFKTKCDLFLYVIYHCKDGCCVQVQIFCFLNSIIHWNQHPSQSQGFSGGSAGKESACNAGDLSSIPRLGRFPGEGKGYPLQYSGLENSMDCIVHGVAKSWTRLSDFHYQQLQSLLCDYSSSKATTVLTSTIID